MKTKEAIERTGRAVTHSPNLWTILGRSIKIPGMGTSAKAIGGEKDALAAWMIRYPDHVPTMMYRTNPETGRRQNIDINPDWQHGDPLPASIADPDMPKRRRKPRKRARKQPTKRSSKTSRKGATK